MTEWMVAYCQANSEVKAAANLKRQGFDVYLPQYKRLRRHARRIDTVIRPLFPRYLFVEFSKASTLWRSIRSTVGVVNVLSAGERPLTAPSWVVNQLRERENARGLITRLGEVDLKKGESVKITSGPFSDQIGTFNGLDDNQRISVLLSLMGREVKAVLESSVVSRYN